MKTPQEIRSLLAEHFPRASAEDTAKMDDATLAVYNLSRLLDASCEFQQAMVVEIRNLRKRTLAIEVALGGPEAIRQAIEAQTGTTTSASVSTTQPAQAGPPPNPAAQSTVAPSTASGQPNPAADGAWVMGGIDPETATGAQVPPEVAAAFAGQPGGRPAPPASSAVPGAPASAPTATPNPLPPDVQAALVQQAKAAEAAQQAQQAQQTQPSPGGPPGIFPAATGRRRVVPPNGGEK